MENVTNVSKVMIDAIKGTGSGEYSAAQTSEAIRSALIEMNGGSNKINPKTFYRGSDMYALVEELIPVIIEEGLKDDDPIFRLVEYKNIAAGDENEFYTEGKAIFAVADAAAGVRGVRRQRIGDGEKITVKTQLKVVRVYEGLNRLMAGRITFDKFVNGVAASFKQQILGDAYKAINAIANNTPGLDANYVISGTYDESRLVTLIQHVEAETGKFARIYGTKAALRKIATATVSDEAKSDMYMMGYYGRFNGTEMVQLRQAHEPGTSNFIFNDNKIFVIAGDDRPVKMVNEGEGIMLNREAADNNDLTQELVYGQAYGTGVICAEKLGIYTITA